MELRADDWSSDEEGPLDQRPAESTPSPPRPGPSVPSPEEASSSDDGDLLDVPSPPQGAHEKKPDAPLPPPQRQKAPEAESGLGELMRERKRLEASEKSIHEQVYEESQVGSLGK